ncbi:MAG: UDP-N-acetylenolpyruvoylglucosamine reductase [Gammaproteobacteria bacterium HGW-Gammaproteobacteria-14]|nr:MAG: UDP-N-acetylenolpyruvoylglucosamine reductase [Gammaproteobacteria bacterium HGW-Gammaproteobacteria-14]
MLSENVSLLSHNTLKLQANARWYAELHKPADITDLRSDPRVKQLPMTILGEGSNVVLHADIPHLVVRPLMRGKAIIEALEDGALIECQAGENWDDLVRWSLDQGLYGLENLSLIPGSVGAAPYQNIGAYGVELSDLLDSVMACSVVDGHCRRFTRDQCCFGYRDSFFKSHEPGQWLVTSIRLRLSRYPRLRLEYADLQHRFESLPESQKTPEGLRSLIIALRMSKLPDPAELANVGSFFKNPVVNEQLYSQLRQRFPDLVAFSQGGGHYKLAAGWLIEKAGWKGRRLGSVGMHEKQALVLVNYGGATAAEVQELAAAVVQSVWALFAVLLEQEPVNFPVL